MKYPLLDEIRRIPAANMNFSSTCSKEFAVETFTESETMLKEDIGIMRTLVRASKQAGLNTQALVRYYETDAFALSGLAHHAALVGYFAAAERGTRIGAQAAQQMIKDARSYSRNVLAAVAPWLLEDDQ